MNSIKLKSTDVHQKKKQTPRFRPTKNNESNISNQAFSFMVAEQKSKGVL